LQVAVGPPPGLSLPQAGSYCSKGLWEHVAAEAFKAPVAQLPEAREHLGSLSEPVVAASRHVREIHALML